MKLKYIGQVFQWDQNHVLAIDVERGGLPQHNRHKILAEKL